MSSHIVTIGHIDGVPPGTLFASRKEVKAAGLHNYIQDGISWGLDSKGEKTAETIVLSSGYQDDVDNWNVISYTGAGGQDRDKGIQVADQSWDHSPNAALRRSYELNLPIRVIRGHQERRDFSPKSGYRYDGLYRITDQTYEFGKGGKFNVCKSRLERLPEDEQEITPIEWAISDLIASRAPRKTTTIERVVRNTAVAIRVKRWYRNQCQICRNSPTVDIDGSLYAEGAHIHALGGSEGGPDVESNVLCLCPNCHIKFDRGALFLTDDLLVVDRTLRHEQDTSRPLYIERQHRVDPRYAKRHREFWMRQAVEPEDGQPSEG